MNEFRIILGGILVAVEILSIRNGNLVNNAKLKRFTTGVFTKKPYRNAAGLSPYIMGILQLILGIYLLITS